MICKCGTAGELKSFQTFEYYWCPSCKDEIKLEATPRRKGSMCKPDCEGCTCSAVRMPPCSHCESGHTIFGDTDEELLEQFERLLDNLDDDLD